MQSFLAVVGFLSNIYLSLFCLTDIYLLCAPLSFELMHVCYFLQWVPVLSDFGTSRGIWSFVPGTGSQPLALHFGDYNLDGFPDALAVLRNTSGR